MYLWVILATFITLLYSYNLSVRPDMDRVHAETKARVVIDKFMAQHNAFKDYLTSLETTKTGQSTVPYYPGEGLHVNSKHEGRGDLLEDGKQCWTYKKDNNSYTQENCEDIIRSYLPMGYDLDSSRAIISKVFCFDDNVYGDTEQCHSGAGVSCCNNPNTKIFIITYQKLPNRWMNKETNMPNADILGALSKVPGYGRIIGYTTKNEYGETVLSGGRKEIDYSSGTATEIIDTRILPRALDADGDFQHFGCHEEDTYCLLEIQQIYK